METGDVITIKLSKGTRNSYNMNFKVDWLCYCGFTPEELDTGELTIVVKFDESRTGIKFVGMGKKVQKQ